MPFDATAQAPWAVPFAFDDYLELVDWTGRALCADKRGYTGEREPKILARLGIDGEQFIGAAEHLLKAFGTAVGAPASLVNLCARRQAKYLRGVQTARAMFGERGQIQVIPSCLKERKWPNTPIKLTPYDKKAIKKDTHLV